MGVSLVFFCDSAIPRTVGVAAIGEEVCGGVIKTTISKAHMHTRVFARSTVFRLGLSVDPNFLTMIIVENNPAMQTAVIAAYVE